MDGPLITTVPSVWTIVRLRVALEEGHIQAEDAALSRIARAAEGGMRDAWSIMDMCLSYAQEEDGGLTEALVLRVLGAADKSFLFAFADRLIDSDAAGALALIDEMMRILLSGPIVVACLLTDVSLGLINRFASQLNVYVLAMPIKSGVAAFLMLFYFMMLLSNATGLFDGVKADFEQLRRLLP